MQSSIKRRGGTGSFIDEVEPPSSQCSVTHLTLKRMLLCHQFAATGTLKHSSASRNRLALKEASLQGL